MKSIRPPVLLQLASLAALLLLAACECDSSTPAMDADMGPGPDGAGDGTDAAVDPGHGVLGRHSALTASNGTLMASAYEARYGDLVFVSASATTPAAVTKEIVDGVPGGVPAASAIWRGGVAEPGDNVGYDTDIAVTADAEPIISYRDVTNRSLKVALRAGETWSAHTVDKPTGDEEIVGRYTSLLIHDGKPAVAYLALNVPSGNGAFQSELRWAAATAPAPSGPADWQVTVIEATPMPCRGICPSGEVCVVTQSGSACQPEGTGCPLCGEGEACVGGVCTAILPDSGVADISEANGLWPSAVVAGGEPIVVYHDRINRSLKAARLTGGSWSSAVVLSSAGAYCSAASDGSSTVHVAYQDAVAATLHYATFDATTLTPSATEPIDDGLREEGPHMVGADAEIAVDPAGKIRVIYQDQVTSDLLTAVRSGPGQWTPHDPADPNLGRQLRGGERAYGFYNDLALDGGRIYGSTFYYAPSSTPKGDLELFEVN